METQEYEPHIDVLHIGKYDVLVNVRQLSIGQVELDKLKKLVIENLKNDPNDKIFGGWENGGDQRILVDNPVSPKFVLKEKWIRPNNYDFSSAEKKLRDSGSSSDIEIRQMLYASASIMNEMSIATDIKRIVESENIQNVFQFSGIDSVDYVEPLIGVINRDSGKKYIVYPFVDGAKFYDTEIPDDLRIFKSIRRLEAVISDKGIKPHDLQGGQFLVERSTDGKVHLHLLDIDLYTR